MGISVRVTGYVFFAFIITAAFILALNTLVDWSSENRRADDLRQAVKAAVLEIESTIPPGMIIEIENTSATRIGKTHIAMEFKALNAKFNRDHNWSMISFDIDGLEPGEKKQIKLRCRSSDFSPRYRNLAEKKVMYSLMVYPEWRDPILPIRGETVLK